jgi:hypothetical protein
MKKAYKLGQALRSDIMGEETIATTSRTRKTSVTKPTTTTELKVTPQLRQDVFGSPIRSTATDELMRSPIEMTTPQAKPPPPRPQVAKPTKSTFPLKTTNVGTSEQMKTFNLQTQLKRAKPKLPQDEAYWRRLGQVDTSQDVFLPERQFIDQFQLSPTLPTKNVNRPKRTPEDVIMKETTPKLNDVKMTDAPKRLPAEIGLEDLAIQATPLTERDMIKAARWMKKLEKQYNDKSDKLTTGKVLYELVQEKYQKSKMQGVQEAPLINAPSTSNTPIVSNQRNRPPTPIVTQTTPNNQTQSRSSASSTGTITPMDVVPTTKSSPSQPTDTTTPMEVVPITKSSPPPPPEAPPVTPQRRKSTNELTSPTSGARMRSKPPSPTSPVRSKPVGLTQRDVDTLDLIRRNDIKAKKFNTINVKKHTKKMRQMYYENLSRAGKKWSKIQDLENEIQDLGEQIMLSTRVGHSGKVSKPWGDSQNQVAEAAAKRQMELMNKLERLRNELEW